MSEGRFEDRSNPASRPQGLCNESTQPRGPDCFLVSSTNPLPLPSRERNPAARDDKTRRCGPPLGSGPPRGVRDGLALKGERGWRGSLREGKVQWSQAATPRIAPKEPKQKSLGAWRVQSVATGQETREGLRSGGLKRDWCSSQLCVCTVFLHRRGSAGRRWA
jgi:hypothetical protein